LKTKRRREEAKKHKKDKKDLNKEIDEKTSVQ